VVLMWVELEVEEEELEQRGRGNFCLPNSRNSKPKDRAGCWPKRPAHCD
jgi:hypothetical protein